MAALNFISRQARLYRKVYNGPARRRGGREGRRPAAGRQPVPSTGLGQNTILPAQSGLRLPFTTEDRIRPRFRPGRLQRLFGPRRDHFNPRMANDPIYREEIDFSDEELKKIVQMGPELGIRIVRSRMLLKVQFSHFLYFDTLLCFYGFLI